MLRLLWWRVRDFYEDLIYGPPPFPEVVVDAIAKAQASRPHFMTMQEFMEWFAYQERTIGNVI